ncbi:thiamine pyrophosphokinase [Rhizobium sp. RU20A]|uniref:thiamine diphosphokinase n=1 Tax=Rhizobium sp. RU20A TaxID=1907412 RepID=UPI0009560869|nr:thiamine diphosphokinase [Rhizobium sp. RU20A]SIR39826.1 thiamine pyrophosphokinase [Rhizobium sp. RU20A]
MDDPDQTAFVVLMGGTLTQTERLKTMVAGRRTIAADGGMRHASQLDLTPELWVGDFDSTPAELLAAFPGVQRMPYPAAKNETDGEIAIGEALARGARSILLPGALGGERSDHAFMHLLLAVRLAEQGLAITMTSGEEEAYPVLPGEKSIDLPAGALFSILGLTALDGLSIEGARYPLADFHLPFGSSRTISNVAEGTVTITLHAGRAILLARPQDFSGA